MEKRKNFFRTQKRYDSPILDWNSIPWKGRREYQEESFHLPSKASKSITLCFLPTRYPHVRSIPLKETFGAEL